MRKTHMHHNKSTINFEKSPKPPNRSPTTNPIQHQNMQWERFCEVLYSASSNLVHCDSYPRDQIGKNKNQRSQETEQCNFPLFFFKEKEGATQYTSSKKEWSPIRNQKLNAYF